MVEEKRIHYYDTLHGSSSAYSGYISAGTSCFAKAEANTAEHSANVVCHGTQRAQEEKRRKKNAFLYN